MVQRSPSTLSPLRKAPTRPGQDMQTVRKQAARFPAVGMTLPTYQYDPRDRYKRASKTTVKRGRWQRFRSKITLKRTVVVMGLLVLLVGGWVGGKFLYNAQKLFGGNILSVLNPTKLDGEDEGRVNILLAGNSADDLGHNGAALTDSIMVMSVDTRNKKAFLLSIPRDLWVEVDRSHQKINEAYVTGEDEDFNENGYPAGGMGQLEQVVSDSLGLPIHYYALINYQALRQAVDAVGGIDFTVKSEDPRGLYDPNIDWETKGPLVKLANGKQHLNGRQALNLARARGDAYNSYGFAGSDFARTENQRKMLVALKSKAVSAGVMTNPAKLSSLSDAIGNNVKTDFELGEVRRLYDLVKDINGGNIKSLSLNDANGKSLLASYATPSGQSALIPAAGIDNFYDIQSFINRQTSSDPVVQEAATVVVLNGTSINGLATKVRKRLVEKNIIVSEIGDAGNTTPAAKTTIIDNSKATKPATTALLTRLLGKQFTKVNRYADIYDADFIIIVGADQSVPTNTSAKQ